MLPLLYAAELTSKVPKITVSIDRFNFCELSRAVLTWEKTSPLAQWLVEVCPGKNRSYFAVCRLTPEFPDAQVSCIALPEGSIRLVALNDEARDATGVEVHVTGDFDPTGEIESFYAVTCTGQQDWKISNEVEFFETFSVVIRTPEVLRKENRAYVQIMNKNRWVNIAHIPGDRMWILVKDRLVTKGDRIRCVLVGPDAQKPYVWDVVTALDDLNERSDDDRDSLLAEAEEAPASEDAAGEDSGEEDQPMQEQPTSVEPLNPGWVMFNKADPITITLEDTDDEKDAETTPPMAEPKPDLPTPPLIMTQGSPSKRSRASLENKNDTKATPPHQIPSPQKRIRLDEDEQEEESGEVSSDSEYLPKSPAPTAGATNPQLTVEITSECDDDDFVIDGVAARDDDESDDHVGLISAARIAKTQSPEIISSAATKKSNSTAALAPKGRACKKAMCSSSPLSPNVVKKSTKSSKSKEASSRSPAGSSPNSGPAIRAVTKSRVISQSTPSKESANQPKHSLAKKESKHKSSVSQSPPPAKSSKNDSNNSEAETARSSAKSEAEVQYLKELRAAIKESGPCRLSTLGAKVKKPAEVQKKLVDFLRSSGEFEFKNTDVVLLKKK